MRVLYCASEAAPILKIGGLGDVAGTLPKALRHEGIDTAVVVPHYAIVDNQKWQISHVGDFSTSYNGQEHPVSISMTLLPDSEVPLYLLGNDTYISAGGTHAFENSGIEAERFAFFSKAIATMITKDDLHNLMPLPDVVNCNDWHTSLIPVLYKHLDKDDHVHPAFTLTIHNLAYQGKADSGIIGKLGLPTDLMAKGDTVSFLAEGIKAAEAINTVSENYAREILTPTFGEKLENLLLSKKDRLYGILNGLDYSVWNPTSDKSLVQTYPVVARYSEEALILVKAGKQANKRALQQLVQLPQDDVAVIGFIGRIEPIQKGVDLIIDWLHAVARQHNDQKPSFQVIILGTGNAEWEQKLIGVSSKYQDWVSAQMRFDEHLAHTMYGGCDFMLMPSKFEPGGLPQMISQRYGTLPIVHGVGGLKDTVIEGKTGFLFEDYSYPSLSEAISKSLGIYNTQEQWQMITNGMQQDFSWDASAKKYITFYNQALTSR